MSRASIAVFAIVLALGLVPWNSAPIVNDGDIVPVEAGPEEMIALSSSSGPDLSNDIFDEHIMSNEDLEDLIARCGLFDPDASYSVQVDGRATGLRPPTREEYEALLGSAVVYDNVMAGPSDTFPTKVDHSTEGYFPPVGNQGGQGSCAAWATTYYTNGYLQAKDNGWTDAYLGTNQSRLMSPGWTYNKVNHGYDGGSQTWTNALLIATLGSADWKSMPYTDTDHLDWGKQSAWMSAPQYRVGSHYDLTYGYNTMVLKTWLAQGYVLPMALNSGYLGVGLGSGDNVLTAAEYGSTTYDHANTIVGYVRRYHHRGR